MKTKSARIIAMIILSVALIGGLLYMSSRKQDAKSPSRASASDSNMSISKRNDVAQGSNRVGGVLPPIHQPLKESLPILRRMADSGHPMAACRLAAEYQFCAVAISRANRLDDIASADKTGLQENKHTKFKLLDPALPDDAIHCDGIDSPSSLTIVQAWRRAAELGNVKAMTNYAVGNGLFAKDTLSNIDELKTYKVNAEKYARRAAELGDGGALLSLAAAYAPQTHELMPSLLTQAVEIDVQESLSLYLLAKDRIPGDADNDALRKFVEGKIAATAEYASPEQVSNAKAAAISRGATWKTSRFPNEREIPALARGRVLDLELNECE
ncbi:hypothetical protein [Lysobacter sp. CA196]|uniref:hypothetical protein n=1 Tax=Lysobacter sp. CA196 TaxID=3455606 RepID=UPI003F8D74E2